MKINFEQRIKKLDGSMVEAVFKCPHCGSVSVVDGKTADLKHYACEVLQAVFEDERSLSGEEKAKRWVLATRIYANPTGIDLTAEEVSLLKQLIGKAYGPMVVQQSWEMLEGKTEEPKG